MSAVLSTLDESLLHRVQAEFREIPGLTLTAAQAQRLWGLDRVTCDAIVDRLTATRVLGRTLDGRLCALQPEP